MRVSARLFFGLAFLPLAGLFAFSLAYRGSRYPLGMLLPTTALSGLLAWVVTGLFSIRLRRPFGLVDAVRSAGWMVLASASGLGQMTGSYYRHYWPQHAPTASGIATAGIIGGCLIVLLATMFIAAPEREKPGACPCGYDLTGNESGVCPECGGRVPRRYAGLPYPGIGGVPGRSKGLPSRLLLLYGMLGGMVVGVVFLPDGRDWIGIRMGRYSFARFTSEYCAFVVFLGFLCRAAGIAGTAGTLSASPRGWRVLVSLAAGYLVQPMLLSVLRELLPFREPVYTAYHWYSECRTSLIPGCAMNV